MPIYCYRCEKCGATWDAQHAVDDRQSETCCRRRAEIIIQPCRARVARPYSGGLISEAETESKYGKDWRETPGSKRMMRGEPERIYSFRTRD